MEMKIIIVKIIGSNTVRGIKLRRSVLKIANEIEDRVVINLVDDNEKDNLPLLYINYELVSKGRVPTDKEIRKYLKK